MSASRKTFQAPIGRPLLALAMLGAMVSVTAAQADDPVSSLPSGPKNLLIELSSDAAALGAIVGAERDAAAWATELGGMGTQMSETDLTILAEYLALNVPATTTAADVAGIVAELPADGRELFAANCLSCHGVAKYYLLQDRDTAGWMDIFTAPYHRRLLTGDNERETFSSYAAQAMPIPAEQIPDAWKE
jgi:mono/diheme cytochrome c family protein